MALSGWQTNPNAAIAGGAQQAAPEDAVRRHDAAQPVRRCRLEEDLTRELERRAYIRAREEPKAVRGRVRRRRRGPSRGAFERGLSPF
jgi:hypothetical protein